MPTPQDIAGQQQLLAQYRQNAQRAQLQIAQQGGSAYASPATVNSLDEARKEIASLKATLRAWGAAVEDLPPDGEPQEIAPTAAPPAPAPIQPIQQIRAPVPDFVGRAPDLASVLEALRAGAEGRAVAISGLRGMGGLGKTQLALRAAQELRADYPDAQIALDLNGAGDAPLSPEQALQQVIRAFRPEDKLPEELPALQRLYQSVLAGRRALILADDARDADQVRALVPPAGCGLLITSRLRFSLDGMTCVDLERLDADDAVWLLRRICGRLDEAQARQIAGLCGYLPLALRIGAGILANNPALPAARYLKQLADERQRLDHLRDPDNSRLDVEATLNLSYAALDSLTQVRFRRLGVLAADADRDLIAGVLGLKAAEADALLGLLLRRNLIEFDITRERWSLHSLVRAFALRRLQPREEQNVRLSYARRVIKLMRQAQDYYLKGGDGVLEGLKLFDSEYAHLEVTRLWMYSQTSNFTIDRLCLDEVNATVHMGALRDPLNAIRLSRWERALVVARQLGDWRQESVALTNLGNVYWNLGEARTAIPYYEQALWIAQRRGDQAGEGSVLGNLGSAYGDLGETHTAISYYERHLAIAREIDDRRGESLALDNLGSAYGDLGATQTSITYYEQALAIMREVGDRRREGSTLGHLGGAYQALGEVWAAIDCYNQALTIVREIGDRREEGTILNNLGSAYHTLGVIYKANSFYENALVIAREINDRRGEGSALINIGYAYLMSGDVRMGVFYCESALDIASEINNRDGEISALSNLSFACWSLGEFCSALSYLEKALVVVKERGYRRGEGALLGNIGVVHRDLGDLDLAISYHAQHLAIARETSDRRQEGWALGGLGATQVQMGNVAEAVISSQQALQIAQEVKDRQLEGRVQCDLGAAHALLDQPERADAYYQQSLAILEEISHQVDLSRTRWAYGQFLVRRGERERGLALMAESVAFEERIGHARAAEHAALLAELCAGAELP